MRPPHKEPDLTVNWHGHERIVCSPVSHLAAAACCREHFATSTEVWDRRGWRDAHKYHLIMAAVARRNRVGIHYR